jgi:tetratricopeptide (TPR) repeat protein
MERHPAEPYLPFAVALRAFRARDDSVIGWIGATLERASVYGPAHFVLARALVRRSPSQARLEYRLAMEQAPEFSWEVLAEAPHLVSSYDDAMELVPSRRTGAFVLDALVEATAQRLPATGVRLDAEILRQAPGDPKATMRAATRSVEDLEGGDAAPWCSEDRLAACLRDAGAIIEQARAASPTRCGPYVLRARAKLAVGERSTALRELETATDKVDDRVGCLRELERLAQAVGDDASMGRAVDKVVRAGCEADTVCVQNLVWAAQVEEYRQEPAKALVLYKKAKERAPDDDGLLLSLARVASKSGLHAEAADDYRRFAERHPEQLTWRKAAQAERDEATRPHGQP